MRGILTTDIFEKFSGAVGSGFVAGGGRARVRRGAGWHRRNSRVRPPSPAQASQPSASQAADARSSGEQKSGDAGYRTTRDIPRISVGTNEVNVVFTVTDKHGKLITDLKQARLPLCG